MADDAWPATSPGPNADPLAALLPRPPHPTVERIIERAIARRIVSIEGASGRPPVRKRRRREACY